MKSCAALAGVLNLILGVVFAILAVVLSINADDRTSAIGLGVGLGVGGLACFLVGLFLLFGFARFLGQSRLLSVGIPATAVIKAVRDTGVTLQFGAYAIFNLDLEVDSGTGSTYMVSVRSTVPRIAFSTVGIGKRVNVRIDPENPNRVVVDWNSPPPPQA